MSFDKILDIQKNMAHRLAKEVELDRSIELMNMIQGMIPDKEGKIAIDAIILEASYDNFSEEDVLNFIDILKRHGSLKLLEGFVKI